MEAAIIEILRREKTPLSARFLATIIGLPKARVNNILYNSNHFKALPLPHTKRIVWTLNSQSVVVVSAGNDRESKIVVPPRRRTTPDTPPKDDRPNTNSSSAAPVDVCHFNNHNGWTNSRWAKFTQKVYFFVDLSSVHDCSGYIMAMKENGLCGKTVDAMFIADHRNIPSSGYNLSNIRYTRTTEKNATVILMTKEITEKAVQSILRSTFVIVSTSTRLNELAYALKDMQHEVYVARDYESLLSVVNVIK